MNEFQEKIRSLSFSRTKIKKVGDYGEQVYHRDGTVSAVVTPRILDVKTEQKTGQGQSGDSGS